MNTHRRTVCFALVTLAAIAFAPACMVDNPCGAGLYETPGYRCAPLPAAPASDAGPGEGGAAVAPDAPDADGGGGDAEASAPVEPASATSSFGKTCGAMTDCGGDAPICPAPQFPYCTQIHCEAGEANAGVCPTGFTCVRLPGYPSGCMKN